MAEHPYRSGGPLSSLADALATDPNPWPIAWVLRHGYADPARALAAEWQRGRDGLGMARLLVESRRRGERGIPEGAILVTRDGSVWGDWLWHVHVNRAFWEVFRCADRVLVRRECRHMPNGTASLARAIRQWSPRPPPPWLAFDGGGDRRVRALERAGDGGGASR